MRIHGKMVQRVIVKCGEIVPRVLSVRYGFTSFVYQLTEHTILIDREFHFHLGLPPDAKALTHSAIPTDSRHCQLQENG